MDVLAALLG
ncbi:hypothetical protein Nmel_017718 [Mimus melanotis]